MKVHRCQVSDMIMENAYIYYDPESKEGLVVDPGYECGSIIDWLKEENIEMKGILLTHGHYDHMGGIYELLSYVQPPVAACEKALALMNDPEQNLSIHFSGKPLIFTPDILLDDGGVVNLLKDPITLLHTPGHTPGGCCFYDATNKVLFSGDTLFRQSVGRSDFMYGDTDALIQGIKNKLFLLPDDVTVYPGHGPETTIGFEKQNNPFAGEKAKK